MKTIVAPTDFSTVSLNAVDYAADLACVAGTNLLVLHVCIPPMAFSEVPVPDFSMPEMLADAQRKMNLLKERIAVRTGQRISVSSQIREGNVVAEIDAACESVKTYAIVMASETAGALERLLIGGRTIEAMRHLSWPLIIVPPEARFKGLRNIGLACDLRNVAESIPADEIRSLVKESHAVLHVIHISDEKETTFSDATIAEAEWLRDILGDLGPVYHFIANREIEKSISGFAEKYNLDLLIIIPKKHDLLDRIFQHSHARRLVLQSHTPVMAIHE